MVIVFYTIIVFAVSKLFRAYGLYNNKDLNVIHLTDDVSKLFRAYGLYNVMLGLVLMIVPISFKALSSLWVI